MGGEKTRTMLDHSETRAQDVAQNVAGVHLGLLGIARGEDAHDGLAQQLLRGLHRHRWGLVDEVLWNLRASQAAVSETVVRWQINQ